MEPVPPAPEARAPPALAEHLVEEILVRVGGPVELVRASVACKEFRRLIDDPNFLRRYRSLHPPLLLGLFACTISGVSFFPADAPHPNAPAARALAGAAGFSLGYLPYRCGGWYGCDARDSRVLLRSFKPDRGFVLPELAVCDPLTEGYTLLPPITDALLTSVLVQIEYEQHKEYFDAFFDPSGSYEEAQFRVMCWTRCQTMGAIFIYSSDSGTWTHGASVVWNELGLEVELPDTLLPGKWPSYAYGCLYWKEDINNMLIKLNINNMEFSTVSLPSGFEDRDIAVIEAGEGRIGMFSLIYSPENPKLLRYSIRQNESENSDEHPKETTIPLPNEYDVYTIDGAAEGYIFLVGCRRDRALGPAFFSLEIKTMKVERVSLSNCTSNQLMPYFGFPPFMSL